MDDHSITGSDEVICKISDNAKCIWRVEIGVHILRTETYIHMYRWMAMH